MTHIYKFGVKGVKSSIIEDVDNMTAQPALYSISVYIYLFSKWEIILSRWVADVQN